MPVIGESIMDESGVAKWSQELLVADRGTVPVMLERLIRKCQVGGTEYCYPNVGIAKQVIVERGLAIA